MQFLVTTVFALTVLTPEAPYLAPYLAQPVAATDGARHPRHQECVRLLTENLEIGRIAAQQWVTEGGGAPAQHCLAIADLAAGFPRLAAARLSDLSDRPDAGDGADRARLAAQAALAWLDAAEPSLASEAIAKARAFAPDLAELEIVAAKVHASASRWQAAADAVTAAEKAGLVTSETYVIRARAHRALGRNVDAAEDVVKALNIDPFDLDALVLRGELRQAGVEIVAEKPGDDR